FSTPSTPLALAAAAGLDRVLQFARVGRVHAKDRALDLFHLSNTDLVGEDIAELDQPVQFVEKLGLLGFANLIDQQLHVNRRAGMHLCFQQVNFATAQVDLGVHAG